MQFYKLLGTDSGRLKPRLNGLPPVGHETRLRGLHGSVSTGCPACARSGSLRRRALWLRGSATLRRGFSRQPSLGQEHWPPKMMETLMETPRQITRRVASVEKKQ
jgi:hypothetical protein